MLRSLERVFAEQDRIVGTGPSTGGSQKLVRSPDSSQRMVVPGHISEVEFQNDKKVVDIDPVKLTDRNAHLNHFGIKFIKKRSIVHQAAAAYDAQPREIIEV